MTACLQRTLLPLLLPRRALMTAALVCTQTVPPPPTNRRYGAVSHWPCSFTKNRKKVTVNDK